MLKIRGNLILIFLWIAGTDSLRCPTCTYLTTDGLVPDGVRSVLHTILRKLHQPECAQDLTETVPEIKEKTCENNSGQAPRCIYYKGSLSLTITFLTNQVSSVSIPLQLHYRGCLNKILANLLPDGCYHHMNLHADEFGMASLLENIGQTAGKSISAEFTGIQCLCSQSFCPRLQISPDTPTSNTTSLTTTTTTTNNTPRKTEATELKTQTSAVNGSTYNITLIVFTVFLTGTFHMP